MLNWVRKLLGRKRPRARRAESKPMVVRNVPELSDPILLFMESPAFTQAFADIPSWNTVHVKTTEEFTTALEARSYAMLIALSPEGQPGAAGAAITRFRASNPSALTVYHGHDYRLAKSATHALECDADVLLVGGILQANLVYCLGTAYLLKQRSGPEPSYELYENLLELTCSESPFWQMQDMELPESDMY